MGFSPFLEQLARHYAGLPFSSLSRVAFVFPNQRSGYFFSEYMKNAGYAHGHRLVAIPEITTMSSLVERWSRLIEARPTELLLLLYKTYIDVVKPRIAETSPALEPDRFFFWGEIILNDFNDIDRSLTNAGHLFRNLYDLKELQTNPLEPWQLDLVKQFWNTTNVPWIDEVDQEARMWVNADKSSMNTGVKNFLKLWEVLGPLYDAFGKVLKEKGLCYIGMAYREAVKRLGQMLDEDCRLDKETYVFIGFSNLSEAEKEIFRLLQKAGKAVFHWDMTMPVTEISDRFPLRLIERYSEDFPDLSGINIEAPDYEPEVNVYAVPSEIGQVKQAAEILRTDAALNESTALKYAVVLPETSLCLPMLNSLQLPEKVDVNITMGYPLDHTPMAAVMNTIARMLATARLENGAFYVRRADVARLLSQPLLMRCAATDCRNALAELSCHRRLFVNVAHLASSAPGLDFLFKAPEADGVSESLAHMRVIVENLLCLYISAGNDGTAEGQESVHDLDREFLESYVGAIDEMHSLIEKYDLQEHIAKAGDCIFTTIDKMLRRIQLSFVGAPLKGIQMMGVLETRALDFETIIITSMNERSFPRKQQKATFIPQSLRAAYSMEKRSDEETIMAYHFYRLIGRARHIHLLYNNDTEGLKSGEMSRYLYQLKYLLKPRNFREHNMKYMSWAGKKGELSIKKTPQIMQRLERYLATAPKGERSFLSASSIKRLLGCELSFFLTNVCGFAEPDDDGTHIDDSMYGTIVHNIMQRLYEEQPAEEFNGHAYPRIDARAIDRILARNEVERMAVSVVNSEYVGITGEASYVTPLEGEAEIFAQMAVKSVKALLRAEKKYMEDNGMSHFLLEKVEVDEYMTLELEPGLAVNFEYIIDRVDRMFAPDGSNYLRIVDYKTGGDPLEFSGVESLVDYDSLVDDTTAPKAITQLMLYSIAYATDPQNNVGPDERIQPVIYRFRDIVQEGGELKPLRNKLVKGGGELEDYRQHSAKFMELFTKRIRNLMDVNSDFTQAKKSHSCKYCDFKMICGRR